MWNKQPSPFGNAYNVIGLLKFSRPTFYSVRGLIFCL